MVLFPNNGPSTIPKEDLYRVKMQTVKNKCLYFDSYHAKLREKANKVSTKSKGNTGLNRRLKSRPSLPQCTGPR